MFKRICSIILIGAVLLGTLCFGSVAAVGGEITDDLSWELSAVGRLTIRGSGDAIPDYSAQSGAPWAAQAEQVKELSLPNSLKSIGAYAFYGCAHLSTVDLGGIKALGTAAFAGSGLEDVVLPCDIKEIPDECFMECAELQSVCFKVVTSGLMDSTVEGAESIGDKAFEFCSALADVYTIHKGTREENLPSTLKEVGTEAFSACESLERIAFAQNGKDLTALGAGAFSGCVSLSAIAIPTGIGTIEKETFMQTALSAVTLPKNITAVGEDAFAFCDSLKKIEVLNSACTFFAGDNTTPDGAVLRVVYTANNPTIQYAQSFGKPLKVLCTGASESHAFKSTVTRKASAKQSGNIQQKCRSCGYIKNTAIAKIKSVKLTKTSFYYTGKIICPTAAQVRITDANGKTIPASAYKVTHQTKTNGKAVGTHSVKVTFNAAANYTGSFVLTYKIVLKGTSVTSVDSGAGKLRVHWKKQTVGTSGYQIRLCKSKSFKSGVIVKTVKDKKATALLIKSLARKRGYYIEVRTFQTIAKGKHNFSAWSAPFGRKTK